MSLYWFINMHLSCQQVLVFIMWRCKLYDVTMENRTYRIWSLFVRRVTYINRTTASAQYDSETSKCFF